MTEYKVELHFSLAADIDIHQVAIWLHRVVQAAGGMLVGVEGSQRTKEELTRDREWGGMNWLLGAVIVLLAAVVISQQRLNRRVLEFLRGEDLEQREILGRLIAVLTEQARKRGHVEVRMSALQKEVHALGQLVSELSERLADGPDPHSGMRSTMAQYRKIQCISGSTPGHADRKEPGTGEFDSGDCERCSGE